MNFRPNERTVPATTRLCRGPSVHHSKLGGLQRLIPLFAALKSTPRFCKGLPQPEKPSPQSTGTAGPHPQWCTPAPTPKRSPASFYRQTLEPGGEINPKPDLMEDRRFGIVDHRFSPFLSPIIVLIQAAQGEVAAYLGVT